VVYRGPKTSPDLILGLETNVEVQAPDKIRGRTHGGWEEAASNAPWKRHGGGGDTNEMEEGVAGEGGVAITKASQCRVSYVGS
jgi:hypothetical protein